MSDGGPRAGGDDDGFAPGQFYRAAWWFYLALAIAGVVWVGVQHGDIPLAVFLHRGRWPLDLALGLGVGLAFVGAWRLLRRRVAAMRALEERLREMIGPVERGEVLSLALISGFSEELFFRGAMQAAWGPIWATAIFAVLHTGPGRAFRSWTVFALVAGAALAALTAWRGDILAAVVAHATINGVNLLELTRPPADAAGEPP